MLSVVNGLKTVCNHLEGGNNNFETILQRLLCECDCWGDGSKLWGLTAQLEGPFKIHFEDSWNLRAAENQPLSLLTPLYKLTKHLLVDHRPTLEKIRLIKCPIN